MPVVFGKYEHFLPIKSIGCNKMKVSVINYDPFIVYIISFKGHFLTLAKRHFQLQLLHHDGRNGKLFISTIRVIFESNRENIRKTQSF